MELFHVLEENLHDRCALHFDGKDYFACEYHKMRGKMARIGVRTEAASVIVQQFEQNILSLDYDEQGQIWYQKSERWIEDGFQRKTEGIFGINVGGSFEIVALDAESNVLETATVHITPGTMSIEEYKMMQQEVLYLFEIFSYDLDDSTLKENHLLRRLQIPLFPLHTFQQLMNQVSDVLDELQSRPEAELRPSLQKVHVKDVHKWTPSLIIEDALKQQGKVRATVNEQVFDIRENRMVKYMLDEYSRRVQMELLAEQRQLQLLESEIAQLNIMIAQSPEYLTVKPQQLLQVLKKDCALLKERHQQWQAIQLTLGELAAHGLWQVESELPEETHLFRMHSHYSELYDLFSQYEGLLPELTDTLRLFIQNLLKSPTLYEVWVLLKIVQQLQHWGLNPKQFVADLEGNYIKLNTHTISGYRKLFNLPDRPFDIAIYYDYTFERNGYRPDFVISFYNRATQQWISHTLDVKYKNYTAMKDGRAEFMEDLNRSANRYLRELLPPTQSLQSASLVHLTEHTHWNTKPATFVPRHSYHKLAHFQLSPLKSENLAIYFKRLLHEGSGFGNCCPSCGKIKQGKQLNFRVIRERGQYRNKKCCWKTHYTCEDCNEFWVANFCSDCSFNDRNNVIAANGEFDHPRPLYKYPTNNYNVQVLDEWEVHCPTCNRLSYPERPYTFTDDDFTGPTVVYHTRRNEMDENPN